MPYLSKVQAVHTTVSDFSRCPQFQSALFLKIPVANVVVISIRQTVAGD